jgi:hypothetical protein
MMWRLCDTLSLSADVLNGPQEQEAIAITAHLQRLALPLHSIFSLEENAVQYSHNPETQQAMA